jgi:hypothetical protein
MTIAIGDDAIDVLVRLGTGTLTSTGATRFFW